MYKRENFSLWYLLFYSYVIILSFLHSMYTESSILEVYLDSLQILIFIFSIELVLNVKEMAGTFCIITLGFHILGELIS